MIQRVGIVVPCYNEVDGIGHLEKTLRQFREMIASRPCQDEIVIVDDGSTDGSLDMLKKTFANWQRLRIIARPKNGGVGAAIRDGFASCGQEWIACYESDCAYPVKHLAEMIDLAAEDSCDVVSASPHHPEGTLGDLPVLRVCTTRGASFMYRTVAGARARDIHTFTGIFRIYRKSVLDQIQFEEDGFLAATEIMIRLLLHGARIRELPTHLAQREFGYSKIKILNTTLKHLRLLAKLAVMRLKGKLSRGEG